MSGGDASPPSAGEASPPSPTGSYIPVLIFACAILIVSTGARSSFGLFMPEMTVARGWSRETFSLAFAFQNLMWGIGGTFLGAMADKYGAARTLILGAVLYVVGFLGMAWAQTGLELTLSAGLLIGVAIGGTSFGIILAVLGRVVPEERRTMAFGVGVASASFGQFLFVPLTGQLIGAFGWQPTVYAHAALVALIVILALALGRREGHPAGAADLQIGAALRTALADRSFHLLFWGYFVCGLQVVFIALHLPAYVMDLGLDATVGAVALGLIGLFNIVGSLSAGVLGQRFSKKRVLSLIYILRSILMTAFLIVPISPASVYVFAALMGLLWLSTVPLTNSLVGQIYGVRTLGTLGGVVFVGHQLGSFLGAWAGGRIFDATGSYDWAWGLIIAFGLFSAMLHVPINEMALARRAPQAAAPLR